MLKLLPVILIYTFTMLAHSVTRYPPLVPDARLTPGDRFPHVTAEDVCRPGYLLSAGHVSDAQVRKAYENYRIRPTTRTMLDGPREYPVDDFEIDHLIPLELGGTNDIKNLWVQSYLTEPWNAHVKDQVELEMNRQVCEGLLTLHDAQDTIAANWIVAYGRYVYVRSPVATSADAGAVATSPAAP